VNSTNTYINFNIDIASFLSGISPVNDVGATTLQRPWTSVAYSPSLNRFVVIGENTSDTLISNDGGVNFTLGNIFSQNYYRIKWLNNKFIALVLNSSNVMYSNDGQTWTVATGLPVGNYTDVVYISSLNRYVMCNQTNLANRIFISTDGESWTTTGTTQPNNTLQASMAYSEQLNRLVSVSTGNNNQMNYSNDGGLTWVGSSTLTGGALLTITWSSELSLFVLLGTAGRIQISSNGINWNTVGTSIANRDWNIIEWISDLKIFFAASNNTSGDPEFAYSFDGKVFTSINYFGNYSFITGLSYSSVHKRIILCSKSGGSAPKDRILSTPTFSNSLTSHRSTLYNLTANTANFMKAINEPAR